MAYVKQAGGVPVCVAQPQAVAWDFGEGLRGIGDAFPYNGVSYNGLDYAASQLAALNKVMARRCPAVGGVFLDVDNKKFSPQDFYDYVHTTPEGAKEAWGFDGGRLKRRRA